MMDAVPAMVDAGVTDIRLTLPIPEPLDEATDFLAGVVSAFRTVVGRPVEA
jgi:hypothetical protein